MVIERKVEVEGMVVSESVQRQYYFRYIHSHDVIIYIYFKRLKSSLFSFPCYDWLPQ